MTKPIEIAYDYADCPTIERFSIDNSFIRGLQGPVGGGKSSGCVIELVNRGLAMPPGPDGIRRSRFAVIRNTFPELRDTTIKTIFQWLPPEYFGRYVENKHTYTIRKFERTEIELLFLALDRPDDIKKLLSLEVTGAWVNEAREIPWSVIDVLQTRVGRYPAKRDTTAPFFFGIWMDTNPPDSDSKWYRFFEEQKHPAGFAKLFKQPSGLSKDAENIANLPGGQRYYTNLAIGKAPEWKKVYVDGEYGFIVDGKLIYPEYGDSIHCKAVEPMPGVAVIRSWDFGLTPACIFSQMLPTGQWLTFDEMTSDNMSVDQFGDEVLEKCTRSFKGQVTFEDYGDPAGINRAETDKRSPFDILQAKDIQIEAAFTQDPTLRQEAVRKVLRTLVGGEPQFIMNARCKMLRKGFMGGYHRRRMQTAGPERYSEKAEKNEYSHCFPAGTLVSTMEGVRPIEALSIGDVVVTPLGPRNVLATMNRMVDQLLDLETAAGFKLTCTPNHPIWTPDGFVRADQLRYGDVIATEEAAPWADQPNTPCSSSTASATIGSRRATTKPSPQMAANTCTGQSGAITMAKSLTATWFTTAITTARTMTSATLRRCPMASTRAITAANAQPPIPKRRALTWPLSDPWRRLGTDLQRVWRGIDRTAWTLLLAPQSSPTSASAAAAPMRLNWESGSAAIAPQLASRLRAEHAETTTRPGSARSAARGSPSTALPPPAHVDVLVAQSSSPRRNLRVFDLTVDEAHCFYANGILVSNCHDALQYGVVEYFGRSLVTHPQNEDDEWEGTNYGQAATTDSETGY